MISPLESKRATGRTTRMLEEAIREAKNGRAVYVIAENQRNADWLLHRLSDLLQERGIYDSLGIKIETPESCGYNMGSLMPPRGAHPNCLWLVDHHAIEQHYKRILEEWARYDAPTPTDGEK